MVTTLFPELETQETIKPDRKPAAHDPRIQQFMSYWQTLWIQKYPGQKYLFRFAADGAIAKRLLLSLDSGDIGQTPETSPLNRLQTAAERFFNGHLKWYRGKESIGAFSKHINHLLTDDHGGSQRAGCTVRPTNEDAERYRNISRRGD
jgi:hypothetical protein